MSTLKHDKPESYPERFPVPEGYRDWNVDYPAYNPPYHTDKETLTVGIKEGWAESEDFTLIIQRPWSRSHEVRTTDEGIPLNPMGRTGIAGRGLLGKWGANYAVDILISRETENGTEYLLIRRDDNHMYAFVGGMVDGNESDVAAAERELSEEASLHMDLSNAVVIHRGYGNDYRNTDNAWIESTLFHIKSTEDIHPIAGDDAEAVFWINEKDIKDIEMHSDHKKLLLNLITNDSH